MAQISERFLIRLKLADEPAYKIAQRAGVNPPTLSALIRGSLKPRPGDPRIVAVGRELGLRADECFASLEVAV